MKAIYNFFILLALLGTTNRLFAHDFEAVNGDGDTIYYNISSNTEPYTVAVTFRGDSYSTYNNEYSGVINIPETVTNNGITYSVTSIGESALSYCDGLTSVSVSNSVTSIEWRAFYYCSGLSSVSISNSVTSIGERVFSYCSSLTSVSIPTSVTLLGEYAFGDCSGLISINVATDNLNYSSIDGVLFDKTQTTLITYPGGLNGSYIVPNSVTSIKNEAFYGCIGLTSVCIGDLVTSIGEAAFGNCSGLDTIQSLAVTPPTIGGFTFFGVNTSIPLIVPCGCIPTYSSAPNWSNFTNIIEDCSSVNDVPFENSINIYPNPAKDVVYLLIDSLQSDVEIDIFDLSGSLLQSTIMQADEQVLKLNINGLADGVYFINITNGKKLISKKLVIR